MSLEPLGGLAAMKVARPRRLVIDTNVIISAALLPNSASARLLQHAVQHESVVLCEASFEELQSRLARPKFDRYIAQDTRRALLRDLRAIAHWPLYPQATPEPCLNLPRSRDESDNLFIDLAIRSQAHVLISGDKDITSLADSHGSEFATQGLQIATPAQAAVLLGVAAAER